MNNMKWLQGEKVNKNQNQKNLKCLDSPDTLNLNYILQINLNYVNLHEFLDFLLKVLRVKINKYV